jgi:Glycosyl hydrolases family 35/Beta-galactosidase, domain 2/Beta-galactosidase second all-beta domain/Beta-galactosidase, domain 3
MMRPADSVPSRDHTERCGGRIIPRRTLLTGAAATAAAAAIAVRPGTARAAAGAPAASDGLAVGARAAHEIAFDPYSLIIDGSRTFIWSGEFHPFRLPSPSLWLDVLQKMKASGYNAVSMYFSWNYHSAAPGEYDFTGVRDMDTALEMAEAAGLYVIARPGPYINAEVNAGGYPGWLTTIAGRARTDAADYLTAADEWLSAINAVLTRHLLADGGGTLILYQIENEYASFIGSATGVNYMAHLYAKVRADGITVPIFHNDKGRNGFWTPGSFPAPDSNYLYAFDGYPSASGTPPDWGYFGPGGPKGGASASPGTPGFEAEFGGGFFDPWGGAPWHGQGYAFERGFDGPVYERMFYLTNVANGIKLQNVYMTFGGTSWGWLPASVVYTSYDYGAAIDETRQLTAKIPAMKQMGYFLRSVGDINKITPGPAVAASDPSVKVYNLANPDTGTNFFFVRNDHSANLTFTLPVTVPEGSYTVPQSGSLQLSGKDMKVLVAGYALDSHRLVYTTSHLMTHAPMEDQDIVLLTGRPGDDGETVLRYAPGAAPPAVAVLAGSGVTGSWDPSVGDLRLNYSLGDLVRVRVTAADGTRPLLLLLADDDAAATFWRHDTPAGAVLINGPELVRSAALDGAALRLRGDTAAASTLEVWAPRDPFLVMWNDRPVPVTATQSGSVASRAPLAGPPAITLPAVVGWKLAPENPESDPGFDDTSWALATKTSSNSTTRVPAGQPVLFADDYGFHYGDVWYRGSWAQVGATSVSLTYQTGQVGMLLAWLDGQFLGSHQMPTPTSGQSTQQGWTATVTMPVPAASQGTGPHVLAVLVRPMSHQEDGGANDAFKQALGLTSVTFAGATPAVSWRIQGAAGADSDGGGAAARRVRGPLNNGGLFGERNGWYLPGYPDRDWADVSLPYADARPGVAWYRATFKLDIPDGTDAPLGLAITDDPSKAYRAQIFLNGWNMGQYVNGVGPQNTFVLPAGILDTRGDNTLAIAVISNGTTAAGLGSVSLTSLGVVAGGVPVSLVRSPHYMGEEAVGS